MASGDRGSYGSVRRVLLDGPDFQRLSADARWVFVAAKLSMGPSGIEVSYREAQVAELAQKTGLIPELVRVALDELDVDGWMRREGNLAWIIGHLDNDPHLSAEDPKHRKAVQRHVAGLPRLAIVKEYVAAHPTWFPANELDPSLAWAFEGPSNRHRSKELEQEKEQEKEQERAEGDAVREFAIALCASANAAARQKWRSEPFLAGSVPSFTTAQELIDAGIPLPDAQVRVVTQIEACGLTKAPRSIRYFLPGCLEPNTRAPRPPRPNPGAQQVANIMGGDR